MEATVVERAAARAATAGTAGGVLEGQAAVAMAPATAVAAALVAQAVMVAQETVVA